MNYIQHCYIHLCSCALHNSREQHSCYSLWNAIFMYTTCGSSDYIFFMTTFLLLFSYWSIVDLQCHVSFWCTAKWFNDLVVCVCVYICVYIYTYTYTHFLFSLWFITEYWIVSYANIYTHILFSLWFIIEYEIQFPVQ